MTEGNDRIYTNTAGDGRQLAAAAEILRNVQPTTANERNNYLNTISEMTGQNNTVPSGFPAANTIEWRDSAGRRTSLPEGLLCQAPGNNNNGVVDAPRNGDVSRYPLGTPDDPATQSEIVIGPNNQLTMNDARGVSTSMRARELTGGRRAIDSAEITDRNGSRVGSIRQDHNGELVYQGPGYDGHQVREELTSAYFDSTRQMVVLETKRGETIELRPDGSRCNRDSATNRPLDMMDANNNHYHYEWGTNSDAPQRVTMQGPGTGGQLWEFDRQSLVDAAFDDLDRRIVRALPTAAIPVVGPHIMSNAIAWQAERRYNLTINGREDLTSAYQGAGVGVSGGGAVQAGVGYGFSRPTQRSNDISVQPDGSLIRTERGDSIGAAISGRRTTFQYHSDGTQTRERFESSVWFGPSNVRTNSTRLNRAGHQINPNAPRVARP